MVLTAIAASVVIALNVAGLGRAEKWKTGDAEVKALVVQGNIGNWDKIMAEKGDQFRDPIVNRYITLSRDADSSSKIFKLDEVNPALNF